LPGDVKSRKRLDDINTALATHASELASIDAAIGAAGERLAAARQAEAIAADKANALEVRTVIEELAEHGQVLDDALADVVTAGANLRACLNRLHNLGVGHPSHEVLATLGNLAIRTAMQKSIWSRYYEAIAPKDRKSFAAVVASWREHLTVDVERRLGEAVSAQTAADGLSIPAFLQRDTPPVEAQQP
jgi:hypothetical protein